jgi:hypothetical protein
MNRMVVLLALGVVLELVEVLHSRVGFDLRVAKP